MSTGEVERRSRIEELHTVLRDAERELQTLTNGQDDDVSAADRVLSGRPRPGEQQQLILDAVAAQIALIDDDGVILSVNDSWRRFAQTNALLSEAFGVGLNYLAICDEATSDRAQEAKPVAAGIRRVLRGELGQFSIEYPCHALQEHRWFRLIVTPLVQEPSGGAVVMHVDVTERYLAEQRLRESLARSDEAESIAHFGSWELQLLDLEVLANNPLTVSDELLRIVGADRDTEFTAVALARLLQPEVQEALRLELEAAIDERRPCSLVHRLRRLDGAERIVHSLGHCFFDASGRLNKLVGTTHDVTDQTRAHEALLDSEREQRLLAQQLDGERARLSAAQRVARVGSWETDLTTFIVSWSAETHQIFATDPATFQPTHQRLLELVHPDDRDAVDAVFMASQQEREPCSFDHRIQLRDGTVKFVEERWQTIFDDEGRAIRSIGTCHDITERRHSEDALRSSRDLLRIASSTASLGGWMISLPDETITISEELRAIHDLPEHSRQSLDELIALYDPDAREVLRRHMEACRRDGTPYDVELPKRTASGRQIWLRSIGEAVRDADGRIIRLQGAGQDVTARKLAECELARTNRALRMLSLCSDVLVHAQTEQELLNEVCRIVAEDGGYRAAWVGFANDDDAKTIEVRASAGENVAYVDGIKLSWSADVPEGRGPAGKTVRSGEFVLSSDITLDTDVAIWKERARAHGIRSALCFPLREAAHTFGVFCLYGRDVSAPGADELKLLQELADDLAYGIVGLRVREGHRSSELKLREQAALLDQANEAIFVRDLDDRITFWNRGAERLYGWSAAAVLGRKTAELFHGTDTIRLARARAAQAQVMAKGVWVGELYKLDEAGRERLISARWSLLRDSAGQPRAVLTLDADITEKRQLETQLLRAQRLESIGTLAGGIAHDLNNVLTPILSSIAMLRADEESLEKQEDLAILEASAQRGAAMVRQLLTFARGQPQGPHQRIDVVVIAGEVMKMIRETFPKDISPVLQRGERVTTINGDPTQIHQLLTNLCVNARDAMPDGGVLTIAFEGVVINDDAAERSVNARPGPYLRVRVQDTGSGMSTELRDRIFEPFFTTKVLGKGTGLGLSTCHAIARHHDGFIVVASELGRGSCFDVYLPAEVHKEATVEAANMQSQLSALPRGREELILVVDDEEAIRKLVRRTLERFGYRVLVAENGAEAVALYTEHGAEIALVLSDMSMPVMDGPTAIVALKAINPAVRIVGSSGLDTDGKAAKARALGVTDWVAKPYTAEILLQTIRAMIG